LSTRIANKETKLQIHHQKLYHTVMGYSTVVTTKLAKHVLFACVACIC